MVLALVVGGAGCGRAQLELEGGRTNLEVDPTRPGVYVLLEFLQQSNGTGSDSRSAPSGLPDPSIPFWVNDFYYHDGPLRFEPLDVRVAHHGVYAHELQTALRLKQAGFQVAVIKLTKGGTFINRWLPGKPLGEQAFAELAQAWAAVPAQFPDESAFTPLWIVDQGEEEARYHQQPGVEKWSEYFFQVQAEVERIVGAELSPYVVATSSTIAGKTFPGVLEAQQASVVKAPSHLIPTNDLAFQPDNVHRTGAAQNALGDRIADVLLTELE